MDINSLLLQASQTNESMWYILLLAFFAGILVSFTPCVYPMIPITAGILQSQAQRSFFYNILSSLAYITGIAVVYATLGYISATTSVMFGQWLASPWFIGFIVCFFLYAAGAMFGFYELYTPTFLQNRTGLQSKHSILNTFVFGLISGTVASPCLTPALAMLLGIVAKQANPFLGFLTLFSFSLGMGILLLVVGAFSSTMMMLPRAGAWMEQVKKLFGFFMLAVCIYFLQPFLGQAIVYWGYVLIAVIAMVYYLFRLITARWR
jgi:thiol:disulfide interchange protein DsbD